MKQVLQTLKNGPTDVVEVPCPSAGAGHLLVRSAVSLISAGTERILVDFGKANLLDKARQQPEKVRMVLDKVKTDGVVPTLEAVRTKLDQLLAMGYCHVGVVAEVGAGVHGFQLGDRVASNGGHAEVVRVPATLCARVADAVSDDEAAFTVLGAIALQGIRLVRPTLGEVVVVTGLGLIGLLAVQLLRAHGCQVLGLDFDASRLALAKRFGAEVVNLDQSEPLAAAELLSRGRGVDAVLLTASTKSSKPISQATQMCRKRGRIVLVGVTGLELSRADFYEKELSFQVSCSYGPGRYDPDYEERGQDYPIGFVRWTAQRNFEAVLDMMADGRLDLEPLISHRFPIREAQKAYDLITSKEPSLGILLQYPCPTEKSDADLRTATIRLLEASPRTAAGMPVLGFVGAGNYANSVLIPAFKGTGAIFKSIVSSGGVSGYHAGRKFGFEETTTDPETILGDPEINTVVIATRHDSHARLVCRALESGKHVFVEKPLCLTLEELEAVEAVWEKGLSPLISTLSPDGGEGVLESAIGTADWGGAVEERVVETADGPIGDSAAAPLLMVGFNRRFAPHVQKIKTLLASTKEPKSFIMTVNAGAVPAEHWTRDPVVGGGRIVGEGCHFIDLLRCLAGAPIVLIEASRLARSHFNTAPDDNASFTLSFADGSCGTVHYLANGHRSFPKERLEVFCGGRILQLDNFRKLRAFGWPGFTGMNLWRQDKGNRACVAAFVDAIRSGKPSPIPFEELVEVTRVTLEVAEALKTDKVTRRYGDKGTGDEARS